MKRIAFAAIAAFQAMPAAADQGAHLHPHGLGNAWLVLGIAALAVVAGLVWRGRG